MPLRKCPLTRVFTAPMSDNSFKIEIVNFKKLFTWTVSSFLQYQKLKRQEAEPKYVVRDLAANFV